MDKVIEALRRMAKASSSRSAASLPLRTPQQPMPAAVAAKLASDAAQRSSYLMDDARR